MMESRSTRRAASGSPSPPRLLGREREVLRLAELLAAAAEGRGHLVLLGGEAGIGKTAIVRSLAKTATERNAAVLVGHCYDLGVTPPYGPWRELLAHLSSEGEAVALPVALSDDGNPAPGGQAALFARVTDLLFAVAVRRPVVVVLEDLHWADPASLDLLRFLGQRLAGHPLLVIVTYRFDEVSRHHPLAQLLPALVREAPTERIGLRRLDEGAMRALVTGRYPLPDEATERLVAHLKRYAEGNPFYAEELLRDLVEEGLLQPGQSGWTLGNLARARVPTLLRQVLDGRIARLGEAARDRLAVAAVVGQQVSLALWQAVAEADEEELLQTVESAVDAHLLEADTEGEQVRFAHALVREALYEGILPPRRRTWHRHVAEALLDSDRGRSDPDAVAYHLEQAGDARAADWLVRAGERARRAYAWMTAKERFAAAVARLEGDSSRARERAWLLYRTGRLLRFADPAQGIGYLEEAERAARAVGDPVLAAYALFDRGEARWLIFAGDVDRGIAEMEAGAEALYALPPDHLGTDPSVAVWVADALPAVDATPSFGDRAIALLAPTLRRATLAIVLAYVGRLAEARAMAEAFLERCEGPVCQDPFVLSGIADAEFAIGLVEAAMGRPTQARAALRRSREAGQAIDHHFLVALNLSDELREVVIPYHTADLAMRRAVVAEAAAAWARAVGALPSDQAASLNELEVLLLEGRWGQSEQVARPFGGSSMPFNRESAVMALGTLARWRGKSDEAWELIRTWLPNGPATEPGGLRFGFAVALQRLAIDAALDAGDLPLATLWLEAHDRWLDWSGAVQGRAGGRLRWARYRWLAGDLDAARRGAAEAVALASEPRQPLALLLANRLLGEIETAGGRFAAAEPPLREALGLADACAAPFERALTMLAQAELRAAEDNAGTAAGLLAEVRSICEPLGAAPTLVRADALAARLATRLAPPETAPRLSAREAEVLRLVAAGRSNPEIARELFISERTVTTHLTHVYEKLRAAGRAQAVDAAVRLGLI